MPGVSAGGGQVAVDAKGKRTAEVVYLVTSDRDADPATRPASSGPDSSPEPWP